MAEVHLVSSPPLVDCLITFLLTNGARAAEPGEFTLRAFLSGKLDLPRAEAVLGVIEADNRKQLRDALKQLAGGLTQPLHGLRDELLNLLADVEAALDFADEDIAFVSPEELLARLAKGMAQVSLVQKQLQSRGRSDRPFRVALVGPANVGKSSLFNALVQVRAALVSSHPGTTRDYVVRHLEFDGTIVELIDTAGQRRTEDEIESQAQRLASELLEQTDLLISCVDASAPQQGMTGLPARTETIPVATKCDLAEPPPGLLATSAVTRQGVQELRDRIREYILRRNQPALAPSLSRCQHHVDACLEHLRRAHSSVLFKEPVEILALELRGALDQLGEMVGAVYTDDLLDRIFSRFCIGK